ncbi:MAG: FUSC family protein [Clostridium sp.]|nr:FUSC family protein [Clostridium sp.]
MKFYDAMQLGANSLKPLIKEAKDEKEKKKYIWALIIKNILCIMFCVLVVTPFGKIFGDENSIVGVVTVMALLTFRFSNLDFDVVQSTTALFSIFIIFCISPQIATMANPILGFFINFISIMAIVVLSCHNTILCNQSILVLSYILLYGNPVGDIKQYKDRVIALIVGGIIVSTIFYIKHRDEKFHRKFKDIISDFDFSNERTKWQVKLVLGVTLMIFIGELIKLPRVMWIGFSVLSIIQPNKEKLEVRFKTRYLYIILGSLICGITYVVMPIELRGLMGILGGILAGYSATYKWQTTFNCFGAIAVAVPIFGLKGAIIVRIFDNIIGAIYSSFFDKTFNYLDNRIDNNNDNAMSEVG